MSVPLLEVTDLTVVHDGDGGTRTLLDAVSLDLAQGEVLGLVGESGSGKSLLCRSLVRLLPSTRLRISGGSVTLAGRDLTTASDAEMREVRGGEIGMIFQNPTSHLDPVMKIGDQIAEGIRFHQGLRRPGRTRGRDRSAGAGRLPGPGAPVRQLSARVLRRHAPARHDRGGAVLQSEDPDRRRADDGARRHHPGADPAAADGHSRQARALGHPDHPRSRHRRPGLRPHRGDAARPRGRGGREAQPARRADACLHALADRQPSLAAGRKTRRRRSEKRQSPGAVPVVDIEKLHVRFASGGLFRRQAR